MSKDFARLFNENTLTGDKVRALELKAKLKIDKGYALI